MGNKILCRKLLTFVVMFLGTACFASLLLCDCYSFPVSKKSLFLGNQVYHHDVSYGDDDNNNGGCLLTMRKQKASDKRTRRLQRGGGDSEEAILSLGQEKEQQLVTTSIISKATWSQKSLHEAATTNNNKFNKDNTTYRGRGRSRKRLQYYNTLATYHTNFLHLLTSEYRAEEQEVLNRLEGSLEDPLKLELSGFALYDMYPERRGNLFSDEVYRLVKANDATTVYNSRSTNNNDDNPNIHNSLPPNHKFSQNDVIMITLQPDGSGDVFGRQSLPNSKESTSVESRVIGVGPTYIDIALPGGAFESAFGPAPNHNNYHNNDNNNNMMMSRGNKHMRLRVDRFFSNIPYKRMVDYLGVTTSIPDKTKKEKQLPTNSNNAKESRNGYENIAVDEVIRETILYSYKQQQNDEMPSSTANINEGGHDVSELSRKIAQPPLPNSGKHANEVLGYIQTNPHNIFPEFNGPQLSVIGAALTRRMTMIQGPPGTGKTTVAASIAFGFVHKCRNISPNTKVLACAFSNVGADNLTESLLKLGLKVVRLGKASAINSSLWDYTLDAAIDRDPDAQKSLKAAAKATANIRQISNARKQKKAQTGRGNSRTMNADLRNKRETATRAVKASIESCNIAATKALREADVIVSTCIGAADARLLAACGIVMDDDDANNEASSRLKSIKGNINEKTKVGVKFSKDPNQQRKAAPDNLPPLSMPFVIVDEACQSVEPATLIPIMSTDSCRSLVLLGDPCQLPPTVISDSSGSGESPLSVSLMSRLASVLPHPIVMNMQNDRYPKDDSFLNSKASRQAVSLLRRRNEADKPKKSYRKQYSGSLLLSVQYRMHPSIAAFSSAVFYDSLLSTPSFLSEQRQFPTDIHKQFPPMTDSNIGVRFINAGGRNNEKRDQPPDSFSQPDISTISRSYKNEKEAGIVISIMKSLMRREGSSEAYSGTIGVVTPYTAQVALIKSLMVSDPEFRKLALDFPSTFEINSVDAYQGRERDFIIFSTVRSNRHGKIGFLKDWRRLNVAMTRAKSGLVVVGDFDTLMDGDKHWASFCRWCEQCGCIFESDNVPVS